MTDAGSPGRRAAAAVVAVSVLQIVVSVVTLVIWHISTVFAGAGCSPDCDWSRAAGARPGFFAVVAIGWAVTFGAIIGAWRASRDLSWVPVATSALTIAALIAFLAMFRRR